MKVVKTSQKKFNALRFSQRSTTPHRKLRQTNLIATLKISNTSPSMKRSRKKNYGGRENIRVCLQKGKLLQDLL
jgi:hypothetical protein